MTCYSPLRGYKSKSVNPSGKRSIVFNVHDGFADMPIEVPCGQCIGCRLERSRQWAMRCVHEASLYDDNCFITLTFNDDNLPDDGSLHKEDFQKFMKRLRKLIYPQTVRYFHCGEYGEKFQRPHHHACLFNFDFLDKELYTIRNGIKLFRSSTLETLWPFGFCTVGEVTFESAAYVARYCVKKVTGKKAGEHYGERQPEYTTMSRRPGIGKGFYENFKSDIFPHDYVVVSSGRRNITCRPPRYYSNAFELEDEKEFKKIKRRRKELARASPDFDDYDRLEVKRIIKEKQAKKLKRGIENGSECL